MSAILYQDVTTVEQMLLHMTDAVLSTVKHMASLKFKRNGDFKHQIHLAQKGLDKLQEFSIALPEYGRIAYVIKHHNGDVKAWAEYCEKHAQESSDNRKKRI